MRHALRHGVAAAFALAFAACAARPAAADSIDEYVKDMTHDVDFVVVSASKSYAQARRDAEKASRTLGVRLNLRDLVYDRKHGLTFSKKVCLEETGAYPCYSPRGRWDEGEYVSVEQSSGYGRMRPGYYVVIVSSGPSDQYDVKPALANARAVFRDAYVVREAVYFGDMH